MGTQIEKEDVRLASLDDELFIADCIDGVALKPSLRTLGSGAGTACAGDDSRLSDDRTADGLRTATTIVDISGSDAPTTGQVLVAVDGDTAEWADLPSMLDPADLVDNEIPAGVKDHVNLDFTLANTPVASSIHLYKNGLRMIPTLDYTVAAAVITMVKAPKAADTLVADYRKA